MRMTIKSAIVTNFIVFFNVSFGFLPAQLSKSAVHNQVDISRASNLDLFGHKVSTLLEYVSSEISDAPGNSGDNLVLVFAAIQKACKVIAHSIRISAIQKVNSKKDLIASTFNYSGDQQKDIDIISNEILISSLLDCGHVSVIASEEEEQPILGCPSGDFVVVFDPLDGSSNVEASIPTGTIFGIYKANSSHTATENILQPGSALIAAGYVLYGASTLMVMSLGSGTHLFTLDRAIGEFIASKHNLVVPQIGYSYSLNEGRERDWPQGLQHYISDIKQGNGSAKHHYDLVYICSFVADVHHVLIHGGMASNPRSHLRLVYECNPIGFLIEQAGGKASTGAEPILSQVPKHLHQRLPVFIGSVGDIEELEMYGKKFGGVQQLGNKKYEV